MKKKLAYLASLSALLATQAQAAVPVAVTTALGDAATDGAAVAGLALIAVVTVVAFKYMRRGL